MYRQPSTGRRAPAGAGGGSPHRIARRLTADSRKLAALAATVATGPNSPMPAPPSGGPRTVAVHVVASQRPLAASRPGGGTSPLRYAPLAARNAMSAAAVTTD